MTDAERSRKHREALAAKGFKRIDVKLSGKVVKAIAKDPDHAELGTSGCAARAIEAHYKSKDKA